MEMLVLEGRTNSASMDNDDMLKFLEIEVDPPWQVLVPNDHIGSTSFPCFLN